VIAYVITYTCQGCKSTRVEEEVGDDDEKDDVGITDVIEPNDRVEISRDTFCDACELALQAKYSRPSHAIGIRTLGDALTEAFYAFCDMLGETSDPDLIEVFPIEGESTRPKNARMARKSAPVDLALAKLGTSVCITIPEWVEEDNGDGKFLMAMTASLGDGFGYQQADWGWVLQESEAVNGHDYLEDGTPIPANAA
jgi:hypothetical protein